ncbi:3-oxoacyl-[acyl-carrier-protein] synthase II [Kribbella orskensis]|uniref:3-oxoacyl-[acyl-carrier-protein] synthase II n=1 Tax=Kribbella orskensis TaxID=2512216 RepID=A0ABY2BKF5_9ACTN|nr:MULTISPECIES: beta-ketoacyl-[acyl-carrier-protein] synthase family protein [Kribbella]TCN38725.1 3-oxoacyl-[acyl-carrier-protein] synthase II [Kribbella sp. VKM Ac-2500]TCO20906.1 3-oxoacyl-[acyl-carrier-protein] synthase II [Kribbella orskensis]
MTAATITGMGLLTPVGRGVENVFDALLHGRSGISRPPEGHPVANSVELAGFLPPFDAGTIAGGPDGKVMDRTVILAQLTAEDALADAGLVVGENVDPARIGVIVGGVGGMATLENQVLARAERGRAAVSPYLLTGILPNMPAARIAIRLGLRGYTSSVGTACASGAQAIADGVRLIRTGEVDVVICGASEAPLFPTFAETFANARALARNWDDPTQASRPFDLRRNGFVLSEGAALLVLESAEHATARGAAGYADVAGYGVNADAHHPTAPRPDGTGAADCMRRAFASARVRPEQVGYVNAHGTSTKLGDVAESVAIGLAFDGSSPAVSSTKALTGHMLGTSGVVEAAASALAVNAGLLPPTYNLEDPDPACPLDHVRKEPREVRVEYALSNSFGFGGQNVSLLFGPPSTEIKSEGKAR